jgi:hypothetical protein
MPACRAVALLDTLADASPGRDTPLKRGLTELAPASSFGRLSPPESVGRNSSTSFGISSIYLAAPVTRQRRQPDVTAELSTTKV